VNVRRLLRDRSTLFFVFILPMLIIVLLGSAFGGGFTPRVAVSGPTDGPLAAELVEALDGAGLEVVGAGDADEVGEAVARGHVQAGLVLPDDYDAALAAGDPTRVGFVVRPENQAMRATVEAALSAVTLPRRAAGFAAAVVGGTADDHLDRAELAAAQVPGVTVTASQAGDSALAEFEQLGRFDLGASQQLLLFVFLTSMTGATALIQTRRLGVARRVLSTPTRTHTIVAGEGLGRFGVALVQGGYIMLGSAMLFGVGWGDPLAAAAVLVLFAAVSAAAALLVGAALRNETQAGGIGLLAGLGLGAMGGSMIPIEFFPPVMERIARVTPHAWALDAFGELLRRGGSLVDVLPQLAVLAGFALVLGAAATWRLHRSLAGVRT
jgi:ABC-2 type transport system permease protein